MPVSRLQIGATLAAAFLGLQLVPVDLDNPPVEEEVPATPEARAVLRRACYACHSNEAVWPWYARIAPLSWLAARDVREGRAAVNFSTWNRLDELSRRAVLERSWEEIEAGEMPLWFYLPLHPEAKLTDADRQLLDHWSRLPPPKPWRR